MAGSNTETGDAAAAAQFLSAYGWAETTWQHRGSQITKWLRFCDEYDRRPLAATEGDVLAFIGFLYLEGRVSGVSLPLYVRDVACYQVLHNLPSPTSKPLIRALYKAYARNEEEKHVGGQSRIGLPASVMRRVMDLGLVADTVDEVCACDLVLASFIFQIRSVAIQPVESDDLTWTEKGLRVQLRSRKGQVVTQQRRPLLLNYQA